MVMPPRLQAFSPPPSRGRDASFDRWKHEEGTPLCELEVGMWYEGQISNIGTRGAFVDIGAERDALLRIPQEYQRGLKRDQEVAVELIHVDLAADRMVVQMDRTDWPEPTRQGTTWQALTSSGKSQGKGRSSSLPPSHSTMKDENGRSDWNRQNQRTPRNFRRQPNHSSRIPLEDIKAGSIMQGRVKNVCSYGVFLDIGAQGDARIVNESSKDRIFKRGDVLEECHIDWVDTSLRRIQVSLPSHHPKQSLTTKSALDKGSKGSSKGMRSQSPMARVPRQSDERQPEEEATISSGSRAFNERRSWSELRTGDTVDGHVRYKTAAGIFVDIGCDRDVRLVVSRYLWSQFRKNDEIIGMRVDDIDSDRQRITVSIEDPELEVDGAPISITHQVMPPVMPASAPNSHENAKPTHLKEHLSSPFAGCKVGTLVNGVVTKVTSTNIYVDIGLSKDATLQADPALKDMIQEEDQIHGMKIDYVDLRTNKLVVSVKDPTLETDVKEPSPARPVQPSSLRPPQKAKAKMNRPARSDAKAATPKAGPVGAARAHAKAKVKAMQDFHEGGVTLEELTVGEEVVGIVTKIGSKVHVDIGAVVDGQLNVAKSDVKKIQLGDQVEGMVIEHIDPEKYEVLLKLPYQLGDSPIEAPILELPRSRRAGQSSGRPPSRDYSRSRGQNAAHFSGWS